MMTIPCVATPQFFVYFAHLHLLLCLSLGWQQCVLDVLRKIKDLLGLCPCNRPKTVVNLVWYHQIHDQLLILQQLKGVWGDWRGHCFRVIIFKSLGRGRPQAFNVQFIHC